MSITNKQQICKLSIHKSTLSDEVVQTTNARELHQFLEVTTRFNDWIERRISEFDFEEGRDFYSKLSKTTSGGRPSKEYYISLDMAKELSMVERNQKGKEARKYFISCEKKYKKLQPAKDASHLPEFRKARAVTMMMKAADHICSQFPSLGAQSKQAIYASLVNPVAGNIIVPLPILENRTYSATEVGEKVGVSAAMVGRIANKHDLKNDQYGIFVLDKCKHSDKQVETFRYNDLGIEKIAEFVTRH